MTRREQVAWAAGFYEGEGSISYSVKHNAFCMSINQVNREPLDRFLAVVGVGNIHTVYKASGNRSTLYRWSTGSAPDILHVVDLLYKHLSDRRQEQIEDALFAWDSRDRRVHCTSTHLSPRV